jgi:hypothetical protein
VVRLETIRQHTQSVTAETEIRVKCRLSAYPRHDPRRAVGVTAAHYIRYPLTPKLPSAVAVTADLAPSATAQVNRS